MASASSCDILYVGIGASAGLPLGAFPVVRNLMNARSPHFAHSFPARVKSGEVLCQPLIGSIGWTFITAPFIHFSLSNCPSAPFGVWHSWQRATSSARYFPRATLPDCAQPWMTKQHVETRSIL